MVLDFWNIDQTKLTTEEIVEKLTQEYAEDFIENYSMWKENIEGINNEVKNILKGENIPVDNFENMSFDEFCTTIIDLLTFSVYKYKTITQKDITNIIYDLRNVIYIKNYELYLSYNKSVESLKTTINTIVI